QNTLRGTYAGGIVLSTPTIQNPSTVAATGYVTNNTPNYNGDAVYGTNAAAWDFTNLGTVEATGQFSNGVHLIAGGRVANGAGGLISGPENGVLITGGAGTAG